MKLRRGSHSNEEPENNERWIVSYADFITLLFAFFVVMYATSSKNKDKEKDFEKSMKKELKIADAPSLSESIATALNPEVQQVNSFQTRGVGPAELQDYVERVIEKALSKEEKKKLISKIGHDSIGVRVSLAATSLFQTGSAKILPSALEPLNKIAEILREAPQRIIIEGHTDDIPIAGGVFESNWELAANRATQVVRYLVKVHGFDPKRLAAISYADQKPVASNETDDGRTLNRRIEFLIVTENKED